MRVILTEDYNDESGLSFFTNIVKNRRYRTVIITGIIRTFKLGQHSLFRSDKADVISHDLLRSVTSHRPSVIHCLIEKVAVFIQ